MLDDSVLEFLRKPLFARLSTNGRDGYPHTVPIWFDVEDVDGQLTVWFVSDRGAPKVKNALADPRAAVTIGGDPGDGYGLMLRGVIAIEDDADQTMTHRMIDRYEHGDRNAELRAAWADDDIVVMRLVVERSTRVDPG